MNNKSKIKQLILFLIYIIPVLFIWIGVIDYSLRFLMLELVTLIFIFYVIFKKINPRTLGFRKDTLKSSIMWNLIIILLAFILTFIMEQVSYEKKPNTQIGVGFYLFYVFISCPSQEFLYRGILFKILKDIIDSPIFVISISSIIYSFLHIIYNDVITLLVTLIFGIIWGTINYYKSNLYGVMLSHAVLGALSIYIGLI